MTLESMALKAVDAEEPRLIDLLATLVRFQTDNPPGHNEAPAQQWMAEHMRGLGMEVDVFEPLVGVPTPWGSCGAAAGGAR